MKRTGITELRLCNGYIPMYKEMVKLCKPIIKIMIDELGTKEVINRFSNPFWFQCFAVVLGFEYNYTGATTVTLKALKEALEKENLPIKVVGGKGKVALNTQKEIESLELSLNLNSNKLSILKEASKISAKVDNSLVQDSFDIYFHAMIIDENGYYCVINQGMNKKEQLVRRYHWLAPEDLIEDPHSGITSFRNIVLNLTTKENRNIRETILDIAKDEPSEKIIKKLILLNKNISSTYISLDQERKIKIIKLPYYLKFPKRLNKMALDLAKNVDSFKELLLINGFGPTTFRALAFISALIYGEEIHWENPQIYAYAHGTKAGKPWYVEKKLMLENAKYLEEYIKLCDLEKEKKRKVLIRLSRFVEKTAKNIKNSTNKNILEMMNGMTTEK